MHIIPKGKKNLLFIIFHKNVTFCQTAAIEMNKNANGSLSQGIIDHKPNRHLRIVNNSHEGLTPFWYKMTTFHNPIYLTTQRYLFILSLKKIHISKAEWVACALALNQNKLHRETRCLSLIFNLLCSHNVEEKHTFYKRKNMFPQCIAVSQYAHFESIPVKPESPSRIKQ